jgi:hypothetical protein
MRESSPVTGADIEFIVEMVCGWSLRGLWDSAGEPGSHGGLLTARTAVGYVCVAIMVGKFPNY